MTEFTVTGIRYQIGEHLSYEEKDAAAQKFVASLIIGQRVLLAFEPDNPGSPNKAIAVYFDYHRIGYIADEQCELVYPLLDDQHQGQGTIVRKDNHVTFFISIPGATESQKVMDHRKRLLPESPIGNSFRMPFTKAENELQLISGILCDKELTHENLPEIMKLTSRYVPMVKTSICYADNLWRSTILKKLEHLLNDRQKLGMSDDDAKEMELYCTQVRDAVGDMHRSAEHWPERVFISHLDSLRRNETISNFLFCKYCEYYLDGKSFADADKDIIASEYKRLCGWLKSMEWSELRNPNKLQDMGFRVNYLGLSREELYDLYSVLLLIEKLKENLPTQKEPSLVNKLPHELATEEALKYWKRLQKAGFIDEHYQLLPDTTRKQAMYIADVFSDKLQMRSKWKPFQDLWHINNLAQEKWDMQETGKTPARSEEIDKIFME